MNISENLKLAAELLNVNDIAEPRFEAALLLASVLQKDKVFLIAHPEYALTETEENNFRKILERRSKREPFQHITGVQEFYGLDFEVNKDVLIPRPETELIVENAIEILRKLANQKLCEVGIGSGCISISILHEVANATAIGLDISEKALAIAMRNSQKHGVSNRLVLKNSDVFEGLTDEKFSLIVSNPPYISSEEILNLQREVRDFEPLNALTDGGDGFSIIESIVKQSPLYLEEKGVLLMEIGFGQAENVSKMFAAKLWRTSEILPDLQGIPRMVRAKLR
jgi:release factor glutamine methyltransferase